MLAAAIQARAEVILTFNLKDFPDEALQPWGVEVQHPQDYLLTLYEIDPLQVVRRIGTIAAERGEGGCLNMSKLYRWKTTHAEPEPLPVAV